MVVNQARDEFVVLRRSGVPDDMPRGDGPGGRSLELQSMGLTTGEAAEIAQEDDVLAAVRACPVRLVEPVASRSAAADSPVGHEPDGHTWGLEAVGALASPYTGAGVKVAVLDTGIDQEHEAFAGVRLTVRNFTTEADGDLHGHGTHCAGTIFGQPVGGRRIGVAPGVAEGLIAKVIPAHGPSSTTYVFEGLLWALQAGANVVSMSLGIDFPGLVERLRQLHPERDPRLATAQALDDYTSTIRACEAIVDYVTAWQAFKQPAILVAATGNESDRSAVPPVTLPAAPPASVPGMVPVGALERRGSGFGIASFSNTGPRVVAPGVDVVSARAGGGLAPKSGTSMATPHAAGVAALWAESLRRSIGRYTIDDLVTRLTSTATTEGLVEADLRADVGSGLVRAPA